MRENPVKRRLARGGVSLGTFVMEFNTPGIGRIIAGTGAEFVVYDMEHTGWTAEAIRRLIDGTRSTPVVPFVRVPATQSTYLAQTLDAGAMGLMIPMVETKEQAEFIVACTKYPPIGRRGAAFGYAHDDYAPGDNVEKMRSANEEGLIIAQIETAQGVENVDAIASVPGIDVLWVGHYDLSNSLGIPGRFADPVYVEAVNRVLAATRQHGKAAGMLAESVPVAQDLIKQGFRALAYGPDFPLFARTLGDGLKQLRRLVPPGGSPGDFGADL